MKRFWRLVVASSWFLSLGACGGRVDTQGAPQESADASPPTTSDPIDGGHPPPYCFADFPCQWFDQWRCITPTSAQMFETHDCHHTCGPGPCSGGTCDPGAIVKCPSGTVCVEQRHAYVPDSGPGLRLDTPCQPTDGKTCGAIRLDAKACEPGCGGSDACTTAGCRPHCETDADCAAGTLCTTSKFCEPPCG